MSLRPFPPGMHKLVGETDVYTVGHDTRQEVMRDKQCN